MVELHEPVSERIGKILRENREAQGLTRQQLSEKSTVSDRQISAIELGEKGPSMNSLELLLRSLGLSADQIFSESVKPFDGKEKQRKTEYSIDHHCKALEIIYG